jgi:hypothetical protein
MRLALSRDSAPTTPDGASPSHAPSDARAAYLAQKREYTRHRGAALVAAVAVPKTTTADVLALATWWSGEVDKLRATGDLDDADRAAIAAWRRTLDVISRRAETAPRQSVYRDNAHVWASIATLADHLTRRQVLPSAWPGAQAILAAPTIAGAPADAAIADRSPTAGAASAVGRLEGAAAPAAIARAAVPVAILASGLLAGMVALRASSPAARAHRADRRAVKRQAKARTRRAERR